MKKALLLVVAAMLLVGTWSATARAEAGALSGEVGVDYASRYIWRGIDLINNNQPAIQPWFSLSYGLTDKLKVNYLFWADYRLVSGADLMIACLMMMVMTLLIEMKETTTGTSSITSSP
jgi:hypothetical protein